MVLITPSFSHFRLYSCGIQLFVFLGLTQSVDIYHNQFAVVVKGGLGEADSIARKHGFVNEGQIGDLANHLLFTSHRLNKRSTDACPVHHQLLAEEPGVEWFQQQKQLRRTKRSIHIPDPLFREQWFLNHGAKDGSDMNVKPAWELGYTGAGVVVTILDDGIQHNHPDLKQNYDPKASKDINDNDDDPMPRDNGDNKHGTRCAGEVAAVAFNEFCGVGIAYNASIGGVRMLDGMVNDAVEARSLSLNPAHIDIYSASWGPEDDGKTVDGPGPLAKKAFSNGIAKGRGGKGSIFVWASGNGGHQVDNCNCDGYTNSVYTLSISSATQGGLKPWYLEECSSTLATTYSSGSPGQDASITTVDQDASLSPSRLCTSKHTGTSASAPLAAGVVALALEANPGLNWRDVQHIVLLSSNPDPLRHETGWDVNSVGRSFSHKFGYGLLDAGELVKLARGWRQVPTQHICNTRVQNSNKVLPASKMSVNVSMITDGCDNMINKVRYLEHVQCKISLKYSPRGNLKISLRSPRGTKSYLLLPRPRDKIASVFEDWPFLSVHFWGEDPTGEWTLEIESSIESRSSSTGLLKHWQLVLHGTESYPYSRNLSRHQDPDTPSKLELETAGEKEAGDALESKATSSGSTNKESKQPCSSTGDNGRCLNNCAPGHYRAIRRSSDIRRAAIGSTCRECNNACKDCYGPSDSDCLSCTSNRLLLQDVSICVEECPTGYYTNHITSVCTVCEGCASCLPIEDSVQCTSCRPGLVLLDGKCFASCPPGFFKSADECKECHPSCETCTGSLDTQCGRCGPGTYYFERRCVSYCPKGYYSQVSTHECMSCPHGCDSCPGQDGVCIQCRDGWIHANTGECLPPESRECQPGMYYSQGTCLACHYSCRTCVGPKDGDCSSCYPDHRLHISSCVETCPERSRPSESVKTCLTCPHACSACDGNGCTGCLPGYYLSPETGLCTTTCPDKYYQKQNGTCGLCPASCATCFGSAPDQCTSCNDGFVFVNGACLDQCPNGADTSTSPCTRCHSSCLTCSGSGPGNCTQCPPQKMLDGGYCLGCEDGFYLSDDKCAPCDSSCSRCTGPTRNDCSSCTDVLRFDKWSNSCVPCCNGVKDTTPCCLCGHQGVCTSPSRQSRSLEGSGSMWGIISVIISLLFISAIGFYTLTNCRIRSFRRILRPDDYSKVVSSPEGTSDIRPFLGDSAGETSEEELDSDFQMINS